MPDAAPSVDSSAKLGAHQRLEIEQRIVGLLALLGLAHTVWLLAWAALALERPTWVALAESGVPERVAIVALLACVGLVIHVAMRMPSLRWPRARRGGLGPWPLALAGAPSLLTWPLLYFRDRRARARADGPSTSEIELAFRQLLALPRVAGTIFAGWMVALTGVTALAVAQATTVSNRSLTTFVALSLASLLPLVSLSFSRVRQILIPELLAAPRPDPVAIPARSSVRWRLGGPAGLALLGAVLVPVLVSGLWSQRLDSQRANHRALGEARALLRMAEAGELDALDQIIAAHPGYGVHTPTQRWGTLPSDTGASSGLVDLDGDGAPERAIASDARRHSFAVVPVEDSGWDLLAALAIAALGLVSGTAALALLLRDVERDLDRASSQVRSVADGEIPEPMAAETFVTAELRELVTAIDKLVGRITDANIHKYVLIEKGHEADRLKSQFLANMSHDLRSPLNSVIGFSDLLLTGIEGELLPAQTDMVRIIHGTGRRLLQQIDDILDTAKIEAGRMELHREPMPPATLISRAIQQARARTHEHIEFDTTFAPGLPPAFIDTYRTTQALVNVLLFGAEGLSEGTLEIGCEAVRDGEARLISLRIVSPRAQVPVEQLEQARRGFFRLPGHSGLGLGLPIASAIVELQGGKLLIQTSASGSLAGRGAMVFELRLPALTARRVVRPRLR